VEGGGETAADETKAYEIAYAEALRALAFQRAAFDALRTRVGFLLSAATIATSFLGGSALKTEADTGSWVAIGLFAAFGITSLLILWPRAEGAEGFTAIPSLIIEDYIEGDPHSLPVIYRELALHAENQHDINKENHLEPLTNYFRVAIVLLTAEITAWVVDLVLR
jgi:hypothetical protein